MSYATGKRSWLICDNCGFRCPYIEAKLTSYNTKVCQKCYDGAYDLKNHPQNKKPSNMHDDIAIRFPRPDVIITYTTVSIPI